jgi:hypothetical protein
MFLLIMRIGATVEVVPEMVRYIDERLGRISRIRYIDLPQRRKNTLSENLRLRSTLVLHTIAAKVVALLIFRSQTLTAHRLQTIATALMIAPRFSLTARIAERCAKRGLSLVLSAEGKCMHPHTRARLLIDLANARAWTSAPNPPMSPVWDLVVDAVRSTPSDGEACKRARVLRLALTCYERNFGYWATVDRSPKSRMRGDVVLWLQEAKKASRECLWREEGEKLRHLKARLEKLLSEEG